MSTSPRPSNALAIRTNRATPSSPSNGRRYSPRSASESRSRCPIPTSKNVSNHERTNAASTSSRCDRRSRIRGEGQASNAIASIRTSASTPPSIARSWATPAPRPWPTTAKRWMPSASSTDRTLAVWAGRRRSAPSGESESPDPRRSGAMTHPGREERDQPAPQVGGRSHPRAARRGASGSPASTTATSPSVMRTRRFSVQVIRPSRSRRRLGRRGRLPARRARGRCAPPDRPSRRPRRSCPRPVRPPAGRGSRR